MRCELSSSVSSGGSQTILACLFSMTLTGPANQTFPSLLILFSYDGFLMLQQARLARQRGAGAMPMRHHQQVYSRPPQDQPMTEAQVVRKMNQRKSARRAEDSIRRQAGEHAEAICSITDLHSLVVQGIIVPAELRPVSC